MRGACFNAVIAGCCSGVETYIEAAESLEVERCSFTKGEDVFLSWAIAADERRNFSKRMREDAVPPLNLLQVGLEILARRFLILMSMSLTTGNCI